MTVQFSIMAVPKRKDMVESLVSSLEREGIKHNVYFDVEGKGPWWNARQVLENTDFSASHHLVLQDDARICANFKANVDNIAKSVNKERFVALYVSHESVKEVFKNGKTFCQILDGSMVFGPAVLYPTSRIKDYLMWCKKQKWEYGGDDIHLYNFLRYLEEKLVCAVPSLVEHTGVHSVYSGGECSRASVFLGDNMPVINWQSVE